MGIAFDRLVRLQMQYTMQGNRLSCNMDYGADAALDLDDPEALVNAWETAVLGVWELAVSDNVEFEKIYCFSHKANQCRAGQDQLSEELGLIAVEALPSNVALVLRKRHYEASSRHNGRIFVSGATETQLVDGLFDPAPVAGVFKDLADALAAPVTISGGKIFTPVCGYFFETLGVKDGVGYPIVGIDVTRSPGTQRRRLTEMRSFVPDP